MERRALVINTAFLGDVVLTTPLFALLHEAGWTVEALVSPAAAELLAGHPHLAGVIVYDKHREPGLAALVRLGRSLRGRYAAVLVPHRSARSAVLARLTRTSVRVGYRPPRPPYPPPFDRRRLRPRFSFLRCLYTHRVEYVPGRQEGLRVMDLARPLGFEPPSVPAGTLAVAAEDTAWAAERLASVPRPRVALFPGTVWESKRYPHFAAVGLLLQQAGCGIVLGGAPDEVPLAAETADRLPGSLNLAGTGLGRLKAFIAAVDLVVCNDSAPLHLADVLGTPAVGIYGPTHPVFGFRPAAVPHRLPGVEGLDCRPCRLSPPRECPLGHHRCLEQLPPEEVFAACRELLSEAPR